MSENIAGYIDRSQIKGQYYRYAASPMPTIFNGDIDDLSGDGLILKAMFATRGQVAGTLPADEGNTFLITTTEFGNGVYLQTAYSAITGYEYKRIYNGVWTDWKGVDSDINTVSGNVETLRGTVENNTTSINAINTETIPGIRNDVAAADGKASDALTLAQSAKQEATVSTRRFAQFGSKLFVVEDTLSGKFTSNYSPTKTVMIQDLGFQTTPSIISGIRNQTSSTKKIITPVVYDVMPGYFTYKLCGWSVANGTQITAKSTFLIFGN